MDVIGRAATLYRKRGFKRCFFISQRKVTSERVTNQSRQMPMPVADAASRRFRGLVQNTSDMIRICAAPGTVTYQSPAAEATWGHKATGLLGEPVMTLVHPDDHAALWGIWDQLRQNLPDAAEEVTCTTELRLRDGTELKLTRSFREALRQRLRGGAPPP